MSFVKFLQFNWFAKFYRGISVNSFTYFKLVFYVPVVNFSVAKVGLAKTASTGVRALMAAVVIMLLAHVTVLQDGRYLKLARENSQHFAAPLLVSLQNGLLETSTKIPC